MAAWLISRECVEKVGGFDTSLFYHYGEGWNYCQRAEYHGFKILIAPKITVFHDRAEKQENFTEKFKNSWGEISYKLNFGNINSPDNELDKYQVEITKKHKRTILWCITKLKFRKIIELKQQFANDIKLLEKIRESRILSKQGGHGVAVNFSIIIHYKNNLYSVFLLLYL